MLKSEIKLFDYASDRPWTSQIKSQKWEKLTDLYNPTAKETDRFLCHCEAQGLQ